MSDDKDHTMKWWIDRAMDQEIQLEKYKKYSQGRDNRIMTSMLERNSAHKAAKRWQNIADMLATALESGDEKMIKEAIEFYKEIQNG